MDHIEAEVSKLKQQRKRRKQEEDSLALGNDLDSELLLLRPNKRVNRANREYSHDTSERTISKTAKANTKAGAKKMLGRVPLRRDTMPLHTSLTTGWLVAIELTLFVDTYVLLYTVCRRPV